MKSKWSKWLVLSLCLMLVVGLAAGCGGDKPADKPADAAKAVVKVGFLGPLTGPGAAEGCAARNAFQLAMDQQNAKGDLPYTIEVVVMDDAGKAEAGASAAQKLSADPDMIAMSGHFNSPVADATIPICKQSNIPMVIWGAIREDLTKPENFPITTRVAPTDTQENTPLVKNVYNLGYKKFYLISDTSSYGAANTATFPKELAKYSDATLLGKDEAPVGTNDFRPILTKVKGLDVDAIYYGGIAQEGGLIKRQMHELKMDDVLLCGISGFSTEDFLTAAGAEAAEGTISNKPGVDLNSTEMGKKFLADYAAANYKEPVGAFTPYAYDAAVMIIAAMKSIDGVPTAAQMVDAITKATAEGLLGQTAFDEKGQTTNPASYVVVVQDGKWVPYVGSEYESGARKLAGK